MKQKHFQQIAKALKQASADVSQETCDAFKRLETYALDDPDAPAEYWNTRLEELRAAVEKDHAQKPTARIGALLKCITNPHEPAIIFPALPPSPS